MKLTRKKTDLRPSPANFSHAYVLLKS